MNYLDELERIKEQLRAELALAYSQQLARQQLTSQQPQRGNDVFLQTDPRWLFGGGMIGYEAPYSNGMLSGRVGQGRLNVNWRNGMNDIDFILKKGGDASINWNGKF